MPGCSHGRSGRREGGGEVETVEAQEFLNDLKCLEGMLEGFKDTRYRLAVARGFFRGTSSDKTFSARQISQILDLVDRE